MGAIKKPMNILYQDDFDFLESIINISHTRMYMDILWLPCLLACMLSLCI